MRVLLVEDDETLAESLRRGLARHRYEVDWVSTGRQALASRASGIVLLDLGLPDIDGLDVCRELRARSDVPLIMISGRGGETEKVVGLELGADDYLVKPFFVRELVARMRAVQRRHTGRTDTDMTDRHGRLTLNRKAHRVFLDADEVALRPKEYALLAFLAEHLGALVTRETIMTEVWDANWHGSTKTLDTHVAALRHKLGAAVSVESVRGVGFRLVVRPDALPVPCTS